MPTKETLKSAILQSRQAIFTVGYRDTALLRPLFYWGGADAGGGPNSASMLPAQYTADMGERGSIHRSHPRLEVAVFGLTNVSNLLTF